MKKLFIAVLLIFITNNATAEDKKIFVGHSNDGKALYITWSEAYVAVANLNYEGNAAKKISKHVRNCEKNDVWYKAELVDVTNKHGMASYKFKFHWTLNSSIAYVDIDDDEMSCRPRS